MTDDMTVGQLVDALQSVDPNLPVLMEDGRSPYEVTVGKQGISDRDALYLLIPLKSSLYET